MFTHPFSFRGRIGRREYGLSMLLYLVAYIALASAMEAGGENAIYLLPLWVPLLWFLWAQGAKRCHDRGNNGGYQLLPFYSLVMLFGAGDPGPNRYDRVAREAQVEDSLLLDDAVA